MKSAGHSNWKDNGEAMQGITETSGGRDPGTKGNSDQEKETRDNRCCNQRLLMGGRGVIIEELMVVEQRKGNNKVLGGAHQVIIVGGPQNVPGGEKGKLIIQD